MASEALPVLSFKERAEALAQIVSVLAKQSDELIAETANRLLAGGIDSLTVGRFIQRILDAQKQKENAATRTHRALALGEHNERISKAFDLLVNGFESLTATTDPEFPSDRVERARFLLGLAFQQLRDELSVNGAELKRLKAASGASVLISPFRRTLRPHADHPDA
ncbi:MAG: hypothetical protein WBE13_13860 [Candidatus Acidiferrum sp.]